MDRPLELDDQLCFPLYAAARAVTRAYSQLLADAGLTYPQYLVLLALWSSESPLSVGELGERLHLDSGTLTPLLKRLETAGHVTRRRDPADERRVLIALTGSGEALRGVAAEIPAEVGAMVGIDVGQAEVLKGLLTTIIDRLESR
ncbi:MarR family transcriptional regulator [Sinomonas sp. ASV322]|uniref:MarR family winged helix-turn-helix transcriptional regulator n=1 Tax=Sinomonas sp. ASV322 TaxID=3041920 RepID=UPI0027DD8D3E|nr:MarR family transcriptional regulator [Sinomonas sp. ASV322]MDQ4504082.1 MarR family transcriptional regulator [Sinomonas sp. ASV322]